MTKVFISYSRKDKAFAGRLTEALAKSDLETWIDWEDIPPTADWMDQIHKGIEEADAFIFLLSPDSIKSEVCGREIEHAVVNGKRLLPVVARDINPNDVHPALAKVNWIYCRENDDFDSAVNKTLSAIRTDLAWVEAHRRLQVRALEWDKRKDRSLLLRGKDLREAEERLASAGQKDPQPTDLQRQYVLASRNGETRTRNMVLAIAGVVMISLALLSIFAVNQRNTAISNENSRATAQGDAENQRGTAVANQQVAQTAQANAEEQAQISRAGELDAQSLLQSTKDETLSSLLSVEAYKLLDNLRTEDTLLETIQANTFATHYLCAHNDLVTSVAFSPDGKMLATGGMDRDIVLWNMETNRPIGQPLRGHFGAITTLAFSPDGKILASGSADYTIILWDVATHQPIGTLLTDPDNLHRNYIRSVTFSPDGTVLASDNNADDITLWDVSTRQPIGQSFNIRDYVTQTGGAWGGGAEETWLWEGTGGQTLAFSPDGTILASGNVYGLIFLWDANTHKPIGQPLAGTGDATNLLFSQDGKTLMAGNKNATIIFWDLETRRMIDPQLTGHGSGITGLAQNWDLLASIDDTGTVMVWSKSHHKAYAKIASGHNGISNLAFNADTSGNNLLALGSQNNCAVLWNVDDILVGTDYQQDYYAGMKGSPSLKNLALGRNTGLDWCVNCGYWQVISSIGSDSRTLATLQLYNNRLRLFDLLTFQPIGEPFGKQDSTVVALTLSPDNKLLASSGSEGILLWDTTKQQQIGRPISEQGVVSLAFSPNGKTLISVTDKGSVKFWDVKTHAATGAAIETGAFLQYPYESAFSPDGKLLAVRKENDIILWDLSKGDTAGEPLEGVSQLRSLAFGPDSKTLASCNSDGILLWDALTHQTIGQPIKAQNVWGKMAFSPDGKRLALGNDNNVELWNMETHQRIGEPLKGHTYTIYSVDFTADGRILVSSSVDAILAWDLNPSSWADNVCQRAGRNFTYVEWLDYFPGENYRKTCDQWPIPQSVYANIAGQILSDRGDPDRMGKAYARVKALLETDTAVKDPLSEAPQLFSRIIGDQIVVDVRSGQYTEAQDLVQQLNSLRLDLDNATKLLVVNIIGERIEKIGNIRQILDFMEAAKLIRIDTGYANSFNNICWSASLNGYARDVLAYCEQAVRLAPYDPAIRDSRGLARTLTGDYEGAILDFQYLVDHGGAEWAAIIPQRQQWIADLKSGRNPLTPEVLESLE